MESFLPCPPFCDCPKCNGPAETVDVGVREFVTEAVDNAQAARLVNVYHSSPKHPEEAYLSVFIEYPGGNRILETPVMQRWIALRVVEIIKGRILAEYAKRIL